MWRLKSPFAWSGITAEPGEGARAHCDVLGAVHPEAAGGAGIMNDPREEALRALGSELHEAAREVRCMLCNDEGARHGCAGCRRYSMLYAPREVAEAFSLYLNSGVAMALFSKLLLYRASGDNARVVVKCAGKSYRVSIHRTNGEVEHFNRDGKE